MLIMGILALALIAVALGAVYKALMRDDVSAPEERPTLPDAICLNCRIIAEEQGIEPECAECAGKKWKDDR